MKRSNGSHASAVQANVGIARELTEVLEAIVDNARKGPLRMRRGRVRAEAIGTLVAQIRVHLEAAEEEASELDFDDCATSDGCAARARR